MRTTIELPEDLNEIARQIAHDSGRSMGQVIADLIRAGLAGPTADATATGARGMPIVAVGRAVSVDDVRSLDDIE